MRTLIVFLLSVVTLCDNFKDRTTTNLRHFYRNEEQHEADLIRYKRSESHDKSRHHHGQHVLGDNSRKMEKLGRCRRYAQNYNVVRPNCYYNSPCRWRYCGYCPTAGCRTRCPCASAPIVTSTTKRPRYRTY